MKTNSKDGISIDTEFMGYDTDESYASSKSNSSVDSIISLDSNNSHKSHNSNNSNNSFDTQTETETDNSNNSHSERKSLKKKTELVFGNKTKKIDKFKKKYVKKEKKEKVKKLTKKTLRNIDIENIKIQTIDKIIEMFPRLRKQKSDILLVVLNNKEIKYDQYVLEKKILDGKPIYLDPYGNILDENIKIIGVYNQIQSVDDNNIKIIIYDRIKKLILEKKINLYKILQMKL